MWRGTLLLVRAAQGLLSADFASCVAVTVMTSAGVSVILSTPRPSVSTCLKPPISIQGDIKRKGCRQTSHSNFKMRTTTQITQLQRAESSFVLRLLTTATLILFILRPAGHTASRTTGPQTTPYSGLCILYHFVLFFIHLIECVSVLFHLAQRKAAILMIFLVVWVRPW